jgi:hypothetical protein
MDPDRIVGGGVVVGRPPKYPAADLLLVNLVHLVVEDAVAHVDEHLSESG